VIFLIINISIFFLIYIIIKEGLNVYIIEINNEIIKKYDKKRSIIELSIAQIKKISFLHRKDGSIGREYTITFKFLKDDKIELFYSHKYEEMVNLLIFLEKFCLKYNIEFQKIKKNQGSHKIEDMSEYLIFDKIDKKLNFSDWLVSGGLILFLCGIGLLIWFLVIYPTGIFHIEYYGFLIIFFLIIMFFLILPVIFIIIGLVLRKKKSNK